MLLDKLEFGVVGFKTEEGLVYVRPAGWHRIYLLWTFRHFHKLPVRLLNQRQSRLVEKLYRSSLPKLSGPQERTHIIGIIEDAAPPKSASTEIRWPVPAQEELPVPILIPFAEKAVSQNLNQPITRTVAEPLTRRSHALVSGLAWPKIIQSLGVGVLCVLVALVVWHERLASASSNANDVSNSAHADPARLLNTSAQINPAPLPVARATAPDFPAVVPLQSTPAQVVASAPIPPAPAATTNPKPVVPMKPALPAIPSPATLVARASETAEIARVPEHSDPAKDQPREMSTASNPLMAPVQEEAPLLSVSRPPLKLIYPSSPQDNLRGTVFLQAVLDASGSVQKVKVISGNPFLANAAVRAVRLWHYAPYCQDGRAISTETNIRISFVASDAVSISFPAVSPMLSASSH